MDTAWDEGRGMGHVLGRAEPRGLLEDNVDGAAAFLDAWEATGDEAWLTRAIAVMRYCGRAHWDDAQGGFFDVARDRSGAAYLATPAKPVQDSPTPSANGVAALVLARLWAVTDDNELAIERSEEHTSELQSQSNLVCRLLLEKKKKTRNTNGKE